MNPQEFDELLSKYADVIVHIGLNVRKDQIPAVSEVRGTELWWIGLAGHVVSLATAPTWFFLARKDATSLGFVIMVPFLVVALPLMLGAGAGLVVPLLAAYMVVMLALLPRVVCRGVLAPTLGETSDVSGLPALERRASPLVGALLREQRESVVLGFVAVVAPLAVLAIGGVEEAPFVSFVLSACVAALSPGLAFSEPARVGTLDHQLALRRRTCSNNCSRPKPMAGQIS